MFKFREVSPSKAISCATNLSALRGRHIVCKVKKPFIVDNNDNKTMYEKGDIILIKGCTDGISIIPIDYVLKLSSETKIDFSRYRSNDDQRTTGFLDMMEYAEYKEMTVDEFKETLEIDEKTTTSIEKYINTARDNAESYAKYERTMCDIRRKNNDTLNNCNIIESIIGFLMLIVICIGLIFAFTHKAYIIGTILSVLAAIDLIRIIFIIASDGECYSPFANCLNKERNQELNKIKKEYNDKITADTNEMNSQRKKDGLYIDT